MAEIVINDIEPRKQHVATAGQTVFSYNFPIFDEDHLVVKQTDIDTGLTTTLTKTTHYTVSGVGNAGGGNYTLVTGAKENDILTGFRDVPVSRLSDFATAGDFQASDVNRELDLMVMMMQQFERDLVRSFRLLAEDPATAMNLPIKSSRVNKYLAFDANGDPIANTGPAAIPISAAMEPIVQAVTVAAARVLLGLEIGVDIAAYNANTAFLNVLQSWTKAQRAAGATDNDGSFDMDAAQDFTCTPAGAVTLDFTNITVGQKGMIFLDNSGGETISIQTSNIEAPENIATELSVAGKYWIAYGVPPGATKAKISHSKALS